LKKKLKKALRKSLEQNDKYAQRAEKIKRIINKREMKLERKA
jgi:hypothetical protein